MVSTAQHAKIVGFNFTAAVHDVIADMIFRLPDLEHIDLDRVAVSFAQTRKRTRYGIHATLTPMRFECGANETVCDGKTYRVQRLIGPHGLEMLYILTIYLPRFMDVGFDEKLVTILHELWHISPNFDGDIRRHPGRCFAHTNSQIEYDRQMAVLAKRWLRCDPPAELYSFLTLNFRQLEQNYGRVFGAKIPHPKLIPVRRMD